MLGNSVMPPIRLRQALVNTQVTSNFFIKHTNSVNDSVDFLVMMTRTVMDMANDKYIASLGTEALCRNRPQTLFLRGFTDYFNTTGKTQTMSARDMFGKQLMQMRELTAERASVIVKKYPTPKLFMQALDSSMSVSELNPNIARSMMIIFAADPAKRDSLLMDATKDLISLSKFGVGLSTYIAHLYSDEVLK